jgi:hypothetical protein
MGTSNQRYPVAVLFGLLKPEINTGDASHPT